MPFNTAIYRTGYGVIWYQTHPGTYCQNNTSASDYGKCYNVGYGRTIFVQTDTATYPTLPCESDGTCTRYTSTVNIRSFGAVFSYSGKQGIVQYVFARSHAWSIQFAYNIMHSLYGIILPTPTGHPDDFWIFPSPNYEVSSWPVYDPVVNFKLYINPYRITSGVVAVLRWYGTFFTSQLYISAHERNLNNIWYASDITIIWAYESSPLAIISFDDIREYVPYQELRNTLGYAANGIDQPGWNADDMIRVLKEVFPDRAWAVFDDKTYTLYLYNLTPDFVPDWLVDRLAPVSMKVLKPPADSSVAKAWLDELSWRNAYNALINVEV
jgi:hypothetical protein